MRRTPRAPDWLTRATAVLAALLLPLGLLSSWVAAVVTDTDRYVSTVRPLAYDEGLRDAAKGLTFHDACPRREIFR